MDQRTDELSRPRGPRGLRDPREGRAMGQRARLRVALLLLAGQSINLMTLFGLAVGIGMLVDNSIVVYEAVQRRLERGSTRSQQHSIGSCDHLPRSPIHYFDLNWSFV